MQEVATSYKPGSAQYIKELHPELHEAIIEARDEADQLFGKDIEEYRKALERWLDLLRKAQVLCEDPFREGRTPSRRYSVKKRYQEIP